MKVRIGFVSNSSSCSFCIYGMGIEQTELIKIAKKLELKINEEDLWDLSWELENKLKKEGYTVAIFNMMGDYFWIGGEYKRIPDDMTGKEFKDSIQKEINELLDADCKLGICEQAWRDG